MSYDSLLHFAVFFSDVGGDTLDSNHGFIAEYGPDIDSHAGRYSKYSLFCQAAFRLRLPCSSVK